MRHKFTHHKFVTKEEYMRAQTLRSSGFGFRRIARELGVSKTTVALWFKHGIKPYSVWSEEELTEYRKKIGQGSIGKKRTEETKRNISLSLMGDKNPMWKGDAISPQGRRIRARKIVNAPKGLDAHQRAHG